MCFVGPCDSFVNVTNYPCVYMCVYIYAYVYKYLHILFVLSQILQFFFDLLACCCICQQLITKF